MANKLYEENHIQDIADALREVKGDDTKYKVSKMGDAVRGLSSGSGGGNRISVSKVEFYKSKTKTLNSIKESMTGNITISSFSCTIVEV